MTHRFIALWLAGTYLAGFATPASAQDVGTAPASPGAEGAQAADAAAPGEIIITAQKRQERSLDVPQSVSVISGGALEEQHAQRLSDYLTKIPSANVVESQPGNSRIALRGINTGGVGATVATYIDETPIGSATGLANGATLAPDLDPSDLERVEVLRGPQGTLYGANSLGGLVKYVTVAPSTNRFSASGETGAEDVSHGEMGWWVRAAGNVPLSDDAAFRVSGFYRSDPGYVDDVNRGKDVNDGKTYGGRFSIFVKPTSELRIRGSVMLENIRSNGTNYVNLNPVTLDPTLGGLKQQRLVDEPNNIDYRIYNATADYDFGSVILVSSTSYGTLDQDQIADTSGVYGPLLTMVFQTPMGAAVDQEMRQRRFTQELRLSSTQNQVVEWTVGGYFTKEKNRLAQNLYAVDGVSGDPIAALDGLVVLDLPSKYSEYAAFANATWHIVPKFDLTAGGRWSHNKQSNVQDTSGALVGPATSFSGSSSDSVFTYSIAPTFKPDENTRVYARIAKGYRPGGPNAVSPTAADVVPRHFQPDTTVNYELGLKTQSSDHRLSLEVTAFLIDWDNIQLLTQVSGLGVNTNGPAARSKGIELAAAFNPIPALSLYANGSYVDAYLTKDAPLINGGVAGDPLPYNPKFQSTIGAEYESPLSAALTGRAGVSWHYSGVRYSDFAPVVGQRRLDDFSQVDAHVGLDFGRFRLDAFVHNLTDARGITNIGFFGSPNGDVAAAVMRPRSFGLVLGMTN